MKDRELIEAEEKEADRIMSIYDSAWPRDLMEYGLEWMHQGEVFGESVLYAIREKLSDAEIVDMCKMDAEIRRLELEDLASRSELEEQISLYQSDDQCEYLKEKIWQAWQSEYPEILNGADRENDQEIIAKLNG